jgi:hypothetical protein
VGILSDLLEAAEERRRATEPREGLVLEEGWDAGDPALREAWRLDEDARLYGAGRLGERRAEAERLRVARGTPRPTRTPRLRSAPAESREGALSDLTAPLPPESLPQSLWGRRRAAGFPSGQIGALDVALADYGISGDEVR